VERLLRLANPNWFQRPDLIARQRILVVEDSLFSRQLIGSTLELAGYQVTTAVDGQQAMQRLQWGEQFDVIIADLDMPELDGLELARWYHTQPGNQSLPWIALSALSTRSYQERAFQAGFAAFLPKFSPAQLLEAIARVSYEQQQVPGEETRKAA